MLKNAKFYGGEKDAYWVRKDGGMTHRDILRRDIDEVLSKVSTYRAFIEYLEKLGYEVRGNVESPNLSVIAEGWQRPVRLKRLGAKYTPDAINDQIIDNQRKPELKLQAKAVTQKIKPLRKQQRIAKRIAERTPKVENLLAIERQQESVFTKEKTKGARHDERTRAEHLPVEKLRPFEGHPFKVIDNEEMDQLTWSILTQGLLTPLVVRPLDNGEYEVISGHRRLHACKKAGITMNRLLIHKDKRNRVSTTQIRYEHSIWCGQQDSNLHALAVEPKSTESTNSTMPAYQSILPRSNSEVNERHDEICSCV